MKRLYFIPLMILLMVTLACSFTTGGKATSTVEIPPTKEVPTAEVPTLPPAPTLPPPPPTQPPAPTVEPTTDRGGYFMEEFDGTLENWAGWVAAGDDRYQYAEASFGRLRFEVPSPETYYYIENNSASYSDVLVEAKFEATSTNKNGIALICRSSDNGWYEFRVSTAGNTAGRFSVYRYDYYLKSQKKVPYVNLLKGYPDIATIDLKNGLSVNTIGLSCRGNELTFYINGIQQLGINKKPLIVVDDSLTEGAAGIGVMSFSGGVVKIEFDWVSTTMP
jgi:hypothetical protein